ncbi:MAG: beta-propeller repeat-containing protein [Sphaerisporangium sp.]|nr:beta-propeller repeat-containing protein [Sphaerisporangium sp.]
MAFRIHRPGMLAAVLGVTLIAGVGVASGLAGSGDHPGPSPDGTAFTPSGWRVTPAGVTKPAGFFPANAVLSPDERAVLLPSIIRNANNRQAVEVLDARTGETLQEYELDPDASGKQEGTSPGIAFSHDGTKVFLATAGKHSVLVFTWDAAARKLALSRTLALPDGTEPQSVAPSPDDKIVYVVGQYAGKLYAIDVASGTTTSAPAGEYPFGVTLSGDGKTAYVSNQAGDTVSVFAVDGATVTPKGTIKVGTHPNFLLTDAPRHRVFVSNGDSDSVSVIDTTANKVTGTISVAPYRGAKAGTSPTGLDLSADGNTLYVADSGNNDVALIDVGREFGRVKGLIPTAWYPTGVQVPKDGSRLLIADAKGLGTGPNVGNAAGDPTDFPYIESQLKGFLQVVPMPASAQLEKYTRQVQANNDTQQRDKVRGFTGANPGTIVPRHAGQKSPIKHVIYVVKENRTYDQVFGDLGKGNGDPKLAVFGNNVTPNQHALAGKFVTLDNYYMDGEVSQDGWDWATEANSNPFNQLATHQGYAGNGAVYDSSGYLDSAVTAGNADPTKAFLWDAAHAAGQSIRHYGMHSVPSSWFSSANQVKCPAGQYCAYEPLLDHNTDHAYPWFDMNITDQSRYQEWKKEFDSYVAHDNLPTWQFVDLPRDHTAGLAPGASSPKAMVADNDLALGKIVETVSHSKYWNDTAIFVTEDDAQDGPDHVDSHRSVGLVISPYTQRGTVDSHFYSQVSMLRTMELLVGLGPLTQYDSAAMPMIWSFGAKPNLTQYTALTPAQPLTEKNPAKAQSQMKPQNMSGTPDSVPEEVLNQEIYRSVYGPNAKVPAPQHNVFGHGGQKAKGD